MAFSIPLLSIGYNSDYLGNIIERSSGSSASIEAKGGYFGGDTAYDDRYWSNIIADGYKAVSLDNSDAEYVNGYRFKIVAE